MFFWEYSLVMALFSSGYASVLVMLWLWFSSGYAYLYSSLFSNCSGIHVHFRNAIKMEKKSFLFEIIVFGLVAGNSGY